MKMNQKNLANIILITIGVVILVGVLGYFKKPNSLIQKSGIKGAVIGQYCNGAQPAEPPPNYQPCGEEPLASFSLKIGNNISGVDKRVTTNNKGEFQVELSPGIYTITQDNDLGVVGGPFSIEVGLGKFIETKLVFHESRS